MEMGMMQPGMMQPGMMQPGMMQPGMMQQPMMQPGMMQPGMMQPGMMQPGMMQPGMMQPGMMMPGMMGGRVQVDPFRMLTGLDSVLVKEKANVLEAAAGLVGDLLGADMELEMANKYSINTRNGHPLFFAAEQTDFCQRNIANCGCGECRGIDVEVVVLGQDPQVMAAASGDYDFSFNPLGTGVDLSNSQKFMKIKKDFACTCLCFNRPVVEVTDPSGEYMGRIRDPWACCNLTFQVFDKDDVEKLYTQGQCCQLGLWCPCPFGPCKEVHFDVADYTSGDTVGSLTKQVPDCLKFIVSDDTDNYVVEFGEVKDPRMKAMMIALALFIDFRYFNEKSDKNENAIDMVTGD